MKKVGAIITNIALLALGVLAFIFMSQAYMTTSVTVLGKTHTEVVGSGFDMIEFDSNNPDKYNLLAISNVFICVFVALIMLIAIVNLLANFGVIKNVKVYKILQAVNAILSILTIVFAVCAIGALSSIVADVNKLTNILNIGWAAILNLIIPVAMLVIAIVNVLFARKSK